MDIFIGLIMMYVGFCMVRPSLETQNSKKTNGKINGAPIGLEFWLGSIVILSGLAYTIVSLLGKIS